MDFVPIFGGDVPEEIKQAMDRMKMESADTRNSINRLWHDLTPEQLVTVRELLSIVMSDESHSAGHYMTGLITGSLIFKHGLCGGCGKDHEAEVLQQFAATSPERPKVERPKADWGPFAQAVAKATDKENDELQRGHLMIEFGLREPAEGEVENSAEERPVICINCGFLYQSLEDRLRRRAGVEGCEGCMHKAKFG